MRKIRKLLLHCSDTPDHMDIGYNEINQWHKDRGWLSKSGISCGYHYIIRRNGDVERGRPEEEVGSHCYGQNKMSLGICWVGKEVPSISQQLAMKRLFRMLLKKHQLDPSHVYGHSDFNPEKTCPNLNVQVFRLDLLTYHYEMDEDEIIEAPTTISKD